jgi:two-component system chemotaxis sensor kinase CheA
MTEYSLLNDPEMTDVFEGFVVETGEILEKLDLELVELENRPDDNDLLNEIFRAFHTIKGTSGFLGLVKLQKVTHKGEDILNKLRKGEIKLNEEIMDAILNIFDTIKELVQIISDTKTENLDVTEILSELETLINRLNNPSGEATEKVTPEPEEVTENIDESAEMTENVEENKVEEVPEEKEESEPVSEVEEPEGDYSLLTDPSMSEIFEGFIVETNEILEKLDLDLVELETNPEDSDLLNEIFRSFHTIKGTSGFLGLVKLQRVTHLCEDLLNKLRKGEISLNEEIMDAILLAYDTIKELVGIISDDKAENLSIGETLQKLENVLSSLASGNASKDLQPKSEEEESKEEVKSEENANAEKLETKKQEPKKEAPKKNVKVQQKQKTQNETIRVEVERLDDLLNIVQELVLGRNRLLQINNVVSKGEHVDISHDLSEATQQIDLMTTELQLAVMKTRMVKIGKVFNRFRRMIRDLSKDMKKKVDLEIYGEDTELDKTLIEEIYDPLVHMVRNSVDHGLEFPEEREKVGKDPRGKVILTAKQEGNNIIISIEDDGHGIDHEVIKAKAIEKKIITEEKAKELSKNDILNLIFAPGFSTAKVVSNVSGRGVGMDVVKTNVTKLRGIIDIETELGKGSKFIIKLPITLAIIQGLLVKIGAETVVIPLNTVIEVVRVSKEQIYSMNQCEVIKLRDSVIPLLDLGESLFKVSEKEGRNWQYIVVVGIAERRFGLKVDRMLGQEEIVIKSLGKYLGNVQGIAGSTIMGDGSVVLIADIAEIVNLAEKEQYEQN